MKCEFCGCETIGGTIRRCCTAGLIADQQIAPKEEPKTLTYSVEALTGLVAADAIARGLKEPVGVRFDVGENTIRVVVTEQAPPSETAPSGVLIS